MDTLDARGLSCPEPVVMISQAMAGKADSYRMMWTRWPLARTLPAMHKARAIR